MLPEKTREESPSSKRSEFPNVAWIVFVLAISIGLTMTIFSATILYEVADHHFISELPPNALQFLIGVFGGTIGIIGAYVGYSSGREETDKLDE